MLRSAVLMCPLPDCKVSSPLQVDFASLLYGIALPLRCRSKGLSRTAMHPLETSYPRPKRNFAKGL